MLASANTPLIVVENEVMAPGDVLWTNHIFEDAPLCTTHICHCILEPPASPPPPIATQDDDGAQTTCVSTEDACRAAVTALGYTPGKTTTPFVGQWTSKGCYAYDTDSVLRRTRLFGTCGDTACNDCTVEQRLYATLPIRSASSATRRRRRRRRRAVLGHRLMTWDTDEHRAASTRAMAEANPTYESQCRHAGRGSKRAFDAWTTSRAKDPTAIASAHWRRSSGRSTRRRRDRHQQRWRPLSNRCRRHRAAKPTTLACHCVVQAPLDAPPLLRRRSCGVGARTRTTSAQPPKRTPWPLARHPPPPSSPRHRPQAGGAPRVADLAHAPERRAVPRGPPSRAPLSTLDRTPTAARPRTGPRHPARRTRLACAGRIGPQPAGRLPRTYDHLRRRRMVTAAQAIPTAAG